MNIKSIGNAYSYNLNPQSNNWQTPQIAFQGWFRKKVQKVGEQGLAKTGDILEEARALANKLEAKRAADARQFQESFSNHRARMSAITEEMNVVLDRHRARPQVSSEEAAEILADVARYEKTGIIK